MDFDDTPEEAAFRAEARAFLDANAEPKRGAFETWQSRTPAARAGRARARQGLPAQEGGGRLRRAHLAEGVGRPGRAADLAGDLRPGGGALPGAARLLRHRPRHVHADDHRLRAPRSRSALRAGGAPRRGGVVPALLRAGAPAPTWPACAPAPCATATTGSSTARRSGPRARTSPTRRSWSTRSDPKAPKHKGLTFFFLDMKSPGIEMRPIKQISGASNFNEVYFTDVRIPDTPAPRRGRRGLGGGDHHADERAPDLGRPARPGLREIFAPGPRDRARGRPGARRTRRCASGWPTATCSRRACA